MSWNNLKSDFVHDIKVKSLTINGNPVSGEQILAVNANLTGPCDPIATTYTLQKVGDFVTIHFARATGPWTTGSPITYSVNLPEGYRPSEDQDCWVFAEDNNTIVFGRLDLLTTGEFIIYNHGNPAGDFTAGTVGVLSCCAVYKTT